MRIYKSEYDVIIIGASIAGMAAANFLANSNLSVLIIERSKTPGKKTCAHGVTRSDLEYIDQSFLNFPLDKIYIHYNKKTLTAGENGIISSINREKYLLYQYGRLQNCKNLTFLLESQVIKIDKNSVTTDSQKFSFRYLVGADGSGSVARKYLNLPSKNIGIGLQYFVPQKYDKFEIFFDNNLFGSGYAWIFPNDNWTGIGCGSAQSSISAIKLRDNFDSWLKDNHIDISNSRFEAAILNCDYRGYRFDNIFLIGDAAGLIGGISGKGMYAAFASAHQVTNEILGVKEKTNHILTYLHKKHSEDIFLPFMMNDFLRPIFLRFLFTFPQFKLIRRRISRAI